MAINIQNGQVLAGPDFEMAPVIIRDGRIVASEPAPDALTLDASGLLVVDFH